eukprot:818192-Amphidinium_carterae.1
MDEPEEEHSAGERDHQQDDWSVEEDLWEMEWSQVKFPVGSMQSTLPIGQWQMDIKYGALDPYARVQRACGHGSMMTPVRGQPWR